VIRTCGFVGCEKGDQSGDLLGLADTAEANKFVEIGDAATEVLHPGLHHGRVDFAGADGLYTDLVRRIVASEVLREARHGRLCDVVGDMVQHRVDTPLCGRIDDGTAASRNPYAATPPGRDGTSHRD